MQICHVQNLYFHKVDTFCHALKFNTKVSFHLVEYIHVLITATFVKFSSRILDLLKLAFYYPPFKNIYETLKDGYTKVNAPKELTLAWLSRCSCRKKKT